MKLAAAYLRATYGADQRAVFKVKRYGGATASNIVLFDTFSNHCGFTALSAMPVQHPSAHHQVNAPRQC